MAKRSTSVARRPPGRPRKLGDVEQLTVRIPVDVLRMIRLLAADTNRSMSDVVSDVLRDWFRRPEMERYVSFARSKPPT